MRPGSPKPNETGVSPSPHPPHPEALGEPALGLEIGVLQNPMVGKSLWGLRAGPRRDCHHAGTQPAPPALHTTTKLFLKIRPKKSNYYKIRQNIEKYIYSEAGSLEAESTVLENPDGKVPLASLSPLNFTAVTAVIQ